MERREREREPYIPHPFGSIPPSLFRLPRQLADDEEEKAGEFVTHDRVAGAEGFPRSVRSVDEMFVLHRSDRTRTPIKESSNTKPHTHTTTDIL